MGILLPQYKPPHKWQRWDGVNLTLGMLGTTLDQAQEFAQAIQRDGRCINVYSMAIKETDSGFAAVLLYPLIAKPPMPLAGIFRPIDWQRPSTFKVAEMLDADYWLFKPVLDASAAQSLLSNVSIDDYSQEER